MTVVLVANIARPISSAISTAFSADSYGLLSSYGLLGASASPDAVIEALFANSEVGAWYDPSDLSTMFQDRAGSTPVTADGQTVGLILDKSKGLVLGSEIANSNLTAWAKGGTATTPTSTTLLVPATNDYIWFSSGLGADKTYSISFTVSGTGTFTCGIYGNSSGFVIADPISLTASPTTHTIVRKFSSLDGDRRVSIGKITGGTATEITITAVSIKEIAGNHATAPSDAARPLKTSTSAADWINYDAVDDVLTSTFPSSLGSSCTVCRANVGAAPTILTGQTIGTSYADSTDNAGLIIINRALTAQETTDVTAWLLAKGATS